MKQVDILSDQQIERLLRSFFSARQRNALPLPTEDECNELLEAVILTYVKSVALKLFFDGRAEIRDFENGEIEYMDSPSANTMDSIINEIQNINQQ